MVRPILTTAVARAALEATKGDVLLLAGTSLMLLAGLRPGEVDSLLVRDWAPGDDPRVTVRSERRERVIRVAPSAASVVDGYLRGQDAEPDEPLLLGLRPEGNPHLLHQLFQRAMGSAGLKVGVHDLRRAAMAEVLADGAPMTHVVRYFGLSRALDRKELAVVPEGYDTGIAALLEATFAA